MEDLYDTIIDEWAATPRRDPIWATVCLMVGSALLLGAGVFILATAMSDRPL